MKKKPGSKKRKSIQVLEFVAVYLLVMLVRALPLSVLRGISVALGSSIYFLLSKRRRIALQNLRLAFKEAKKDDDIRRLARQSCGSFLLTAAETIKFHFRAPHPDALHELGYSPREIKELEGLLQKAKRVHDESNGCIFVTPHIGNWELLLYVSSIIGIPLAVVVRPLDNAYLERLLYKNRSVAGQLMIPKKNAFFRLQSVLRQGKSIALLPDQSTMKGISVDFFGRKATTTPIPALLAIVHKRPIVVVACCRRASDNHFEGFVSDPIRPGEYASEKAEIFRLTEEMNRRMETVIRKFPDQYLWMHNRWKTYKNKKEFYS